MEADSVIGQTSTAVNRTLLIVTATTDDRNRLVK